MKINPAIKPDIQEEIVELLPASLHTSLKLMAQLTGNMLNESKTITIDEYIADLKAQYLIYKRMLKNAK